MVPVATVEQNSPVVLVRRRVCSGQPQMTCSFRPEPRIWPSRSTNFPSSQILIRPSAPGRDVASAVPRSDALMARCAAGVIVIAIMELNEPMIELFLTDEAEPCTAVA